MSDPQPRTPHLTAPYERPAPQVSTEPPSILPAEAYELIAGLTSDYLFSYRVEPDGSLFPEWFSESFTRVTGYTVEDIRAHGWASILPDDAVEAACGRLERMLAGESVTSEHRFFTKYGEVRWIQSAAGPMRDEAGRIVRVIGAAQDITERKRAEEAAAQRQAEIEQLNLRLQRTMAETHHRVKNNLQIISALVDMQMMTGGESVPVAEIERLGQHIRALASIHEILTQEAKTGAELDHISVRAMLERLLPILQRTVGRRGIRFEVDDVGLPVRQGTSLAVVVNELVSNAVKHGTGDIELSFQVRRDEASLEVRDDGPGFPPGFYPRRAAHTGLELVESISRWDLRGETFYETRQEGGGRVRVVFPLTN